MSASAMPDLQSQAPPISVEPPAPEEIEIVVESEQPDDHDKPRNPKAPPVPEANPEIDNISQSVNKRIGQLTWKAKQAERERDENSRKYQEALRYAQTVHAANQELVKRFQDAQKFQQEEVKKRAAAEALAAKEQLRRAHEQADANEIAEATRRMSDASALLKHAELQEPSMVPPFPQFQPPQFQPQPPPVEPNEYAKDWLSRNRWYFNDPQRKSEADHVSGILESRGLSLDDPRHWESLDQYFQAANAVASGNPVPAPTPASAAPAKPQPQQVVAGVPQDTPPASAPKASPKQIRLTREQEALIKQLMPDIPFAKAAKLYIENLRQEQNNG